MSAKKADLFKKIAQSELCNRCGSCIALGKGKIAFSDKTGKYLPIVKEALTEDEASLLLEACSGWSFDFPKYRQLFFGDSPSFNIFIGPYYSLAIGHTTDEEIRQKAASGGILSAILIYLLEKGMIDGAVVLKMSASEPWLTQPFIATSRDQILEAAQSKYILSSLNEILPQIAEFKGVLAYVGLPGQVQSIRKLQAINHPSVANIKYLFGPFYGNTLYFSSIKSFLRSHGERDYKQISKLYFRYGEWPGKMRIEMKNGRVIELPKFHANYLIPFHIVKNSLYCTDLTNEFTDISGGDAWAPVYEERGKGFSMLIARSAIGKQIIDDMVKEGRLSNWDLTEDEAIKMHSHGYDLKKRGTFIRLKFRTMFGKPIPEYGYKLGGFKFGRIAMEMVLGLLFFILGTSFSRWLVEQISHQFIGNMFERARKSWKKLTHNIKREDLLKKQG
jgi:coenzyme F420 hydrogenase subunit beta